MDTFDLLASTVLQQEITEMTELLKFAGELLLFGVLIGTFVSAAGGMCACIDYKWRCSRGKLEIGALLEK